MDSDRPATVALTVSAADWRGVIDGLDTSEAIGMFAERIVRAVLGASTDVAWLKTGEVSLLLTDDREIRSLNSAYRGKDRATNVLSFPGLDLIDGQADMTPQQGQVMLGDIVMSVDRSMAEAGELEKAPVDHVAHLLVHGTLHLLGFDHDDDDRAETMERLEASILQTLGFAAPYGPISDGAVGEKTVMSAAS